MGSNSGMIFAVWLVFSFTVMLNACSDGDKTIWGGTVFVEHQMDNLPDSVHHVLYTLVDEQGNRTLLSSSFSISSLHVLPNIPINTTAIVIEFCAESGEVLDEDVQPIAFAAYVAYSAPRYNPEFVDGRVAVVDVDEATGNVLVRGSIPLTGDTREVKSYQYEAIKAIVKEKMKTLDPDFNFEIADYDVIEFVLHDNATNAIELNLEMNALGRSLDDIVNGYGRKWLPYDDNSDWEPETIYTSTLAEKILGGLVWWPVFGCPSKPCDNTDKKYNGLYTETEVALNKMHFINASAYLRTLLTTSESSGKKRLIYFHCVTGTDRTGALHITYIMDNNAAMTFKEAIEKAKIGAMQGSNIQQLDPVLVPLCTYVGLAYRYCQEKNKENLARCGEMPDGLGANISLCRP
jgi:signal peptidase I